MLCYQSRVGPLQWIGPATEHEIERAGRDKVPVIVVPIAFVSEHSETIYEIDMLYRELADKEGVPYFAAVPTVGTSPDFIAGLAQLVRRAAESSCACLSSGDGILCPPEFSGCRQRIKDSA
jgi:ferrochelatase